MSNKSWTSFLVLAGGRKELIQAKLKELKVRHGDKFLRVLENKCVTHYHCSYICICIHL